MPMNYLISILPIIIYLAILIFLDSFSLIKKERVVGSVTWGILTCLLIFVTNEVLPEIYIAKLSPFIPLIEEVLKYSLIVYLILRNKYAFLLEAAIYGAAVGAGFALLENLLYAYYGAETMATADFLYRGLGTAVLHIGLTSIASTLLLFIFKQKKKPISIPIALIPSITLHYIHNGFFLSPLLSLVVTFIGLSTILLLLFIWNEHLIHKWLERSMNDEVTLYSSIKRGELSHTPSGKYLLSVREQFVAEVYFDMIVCVNLYLELSLLAKRNLMLKEAGIEVPSDENKESQEKIKEFKTLLRTIGKTGIYTLSPLINIKEINNWIKLFIN